MLTRPPFFERDFADDSGDFGRNDDRFIGQRCAHGFDRDRDGVDAWFSHFDPDRASAPPELAIAFRRLASALLIPIPGARADAGKQEYDDELGYDAHGNKESATYQSVISVRWRGMARKSGNIRVALATQ